VDEGRDVGYRVRHNCPNAREFRAALGDDEADLVVFNLSAYGGGMPLNTPFVAESTECRVCGTYLRGWFEWTGSQHIVLGR